MLSDHEKRELALMEQALQDDPGCMRSLRRMNDPWGRHLWKVRAAIGFGVFLMVAGMILDLGSVLFEGSLVVVVVGLGWLHVRTRRTTRSRQRKARNHSAWYRD
jgi:hypothetical protein